MGLFSKESCIVCGGKVNALTKAKTAEGSVCSSCLSLCSPNFVSNIKNKNVSEIKMHIEYIKENQELYKNFQATDTVAKLFFVDKSKRLFHVPAPAVSIYNKTPIVYSFDNIVDYELVVDGETYTKGGASIGRALVGGAVFGGVGAVIGGTTGKKSQKEMIKKMYIKITLNHTYDTYTEISLISADTKKGSFLYNTMTDCANKILALLDSITAESSAPASFVSAADEILKYKQLLDCGAITEEEFNKKKSELLNL